MTEATRPAATAAQRIVAAMWTLNRPATAKQIAKTAQVGYSTVSPVLRNLLANSQAVKSEGDDGSTCWRLVTDVRTTLAAANGDTAPTATGRHDPTGVRGPDGDGATAGTATPDDTDRADEAVDPADPNTDATDAHPATSDRRHEDLPPHAGPQPPERASEDHNHAAATPADPSTTGPEPGAPAEPELAEPERETADASDADASAAKTTRAYRKPVKPRRPKGALRAAIQAALAAEPDRAFRVGDMCKIINGADPDGVFNKAGAGAVVNALDKLATDGDAIRVSETPATYQFQAKPADADSPS